MGAEPVAVVRAYREAGTLDASEVVARFVERVEDYGATVVRSSDPAETVAKLLTGRVVVAPDLPAALRPSGVELVEDYGLTARELDENVAAAVPIISPHVRPDGNARGPSRC